MEEEISPLKSAGEFLVRKKQYEETVRKYKLILKEKLDISQFCSENLLRYLPLHTCVAEKNWPALEAAIEVLSDQGDINRFMTNSCGVNVLHIFFSFHYDKEDRKTVKQCLGNAKEDRKTVKQCLGNAKEDRKTVKRCLGNALWNKLLKERSCPELSRGHRHGGGFRDGFSCLHFACEFNNVNAFDYLVKSGLQISDRTANGKTGIDLLLNHYDTERIIVEFFKYIPIPMENDQKKSDLHLKELYLYSLIDPVRAARIEHNPRESLHRLARKLQRLCHSEQEQSELLRFPIASLDSFISGRLTLATNSRQHQRQIPLGVQLLARCLESDDSEGVAQLAALGLLDSMWQKEFCKDFKATLKDTKEPEIDIVEYCMEQKKYKVCQEILRYRQFDLVPTCLRVLIKCKKQGDEPHHREALKLLKNAAKNILLNALNALECPPSSGPVGENNTLVMNYIERTHGPSFQEFGEPQGQNVSVAQLLESSGEEEVFSTGSVRQLVSDSWKGQEDSVCAPQTKFFFNLATHFAFTVLLSVFITMGESCYSLKTAGGLLIYILLWPFALDFIVIDLLSISTFQKDTKPGRIVKWTFGFLGSLLLLAGLIGVLFAEFYSPQVQDGVHMCLATAYLIMVIRLLGFFRWLNFGNIGPTVGIIERLLLNDLLPFLLIFLIFIVAFGVFFQVLLHPGRQVYSFSSGQPQSQGVGEAIVGVYARPLLLAFGELEIDSLRSCLSGQNCSDLKDSDCTCPHALGARLYLALFAFVFLILNLALLNLLIAKFNLTVNTGVRQAFVTWNCYRYQMLRQFQWLPPVPLPFRWFGIAARRCGCHLRCNKVEPRLSYIVQTSNQELINDENYNKFLKFQAQRFRGRRPAMIKPVEFKENDDVN